MNVISDDYGFKNTLKLLPADKDEAMAQYRILNSFLKEQNDEGTGNE